MSRVTHLLIHTVDIQRIMRVSQGRGVFTDVPTTVLYGVAFRVAGASSTEKTKAEQLKTYASHVGYGEPDLDIQRGDVVVNVIREDGTMDPSNYRVTGEVPPSIRHHTKVLMEEIQKGISA